MTRKITTALLSLALAACSGGDTGGTGGGTPVNPVAPKETIVDVQAYPYPVTASGPNRTAPYGRLDNPTGIVVVAGQKVVINVDNAIGEMNVIVNNPNKSDVLVQTATLHQGENIITVAEAGLLYILCQTNDANWRDMKTQVRIKGTPNGMYVRGKSDPTQWTAMLDAAKFSHIDILGQYTTVILPVSNLRASVPDVEAYIATWDEIAYEEQRFAGLEKYNRMNPTRITVIGSGAFSSHMFARWWSDYSFTGYSEGAFREIMPTATLRTTGAWGPAHEMGHVNQLRPAFRWGGSGVAGNMGEVSNNVFSMYIKHVVFGNPSDLLTGGHYDVAWRRFFVGGALHTDGDKSSVYSEVFNRLVPFWQLYLYFTEAGHYKGSGGPHEFYMDLMEALRTDATYATYGTANDAQVRYCMDRFVWHVSRVAQTNMVKFFNDYGFALSPSVVAEIEALGHPAPAHEMRYINDGNVELFKNPTALVAGTATISGSGPVYTVVLSGGSGAVAYEVFDREGASARPIRIALDSRFEVTTNAGKQTLTIKAVGANGTRQNTNIQ